MTPASTGAPRARRLTREQLVTALLVGAVVILLGFASGLGVSPATSPAAVPVAPATSMPPLAVEPAAAPPATSTAAAPPVAYVAEPGPPAAAPVVVAAPPAASTTSGTTPTAPPASAPAPTAAAPPTSPPAATPTSATPAPPACSPSLLSSLVGLLLPTPSTGDDPGLLGGLLQSITQITAADGLLQAGSDSLLSQVTGLLGTPGVLPAGVTASPALARACTGEAQQALTGIAAGQDVPAAVRQAGR